MKYLINPRSVTETLVDKLDGLYAKSSTVAHCKRLDGLLDKIEDDDSGCASLMLDHKKDKFLTLSKHIWSLVISVLPFY